MTIEARTAIYGASSTQQHMMLQSNRRDSTSSNGYQDSKSEDDDGYFTSAVSVQHKTAAGMKGVEVVSSSSTSSTLENSHYKKVVWPNNAHHQQKQIIEEQQHHHHHQEFSNSHQADKPMAWMKNVANNEQHTAQAAAEAIELDIQKKVWDATTGRRVSRSRSRSKNIMERARSFERAAEAVAAGSQPGSRAPSRQGSFSNGLPSAPSRLGRRQRSPSAGRNIAEFWQNETNSRPQSRAGRERSVGRVDTTQWEAAMARAKAEQPAPPKTPPQRRRELKAPSPAPPPPPPPREEIRPTFNNNRTRFQDHESTPTPPPPPPPPRQHEGELKSIHTLSAEEKEQIVEQWVEQTSTQEARDELEKFAYEIAETVVNTMEKQQLQTSEAAVEATANVVSTSTGKQRTESTFKEQNNNHDYKRTDSHFGHVRTGHVNEKRNFWLRSASIDKIHEASPGPRRRAPSRQGESWIRQQSERPGSSLGQVISANQQGSEQQSVKSAVSGWSELSKSKSSAAVLQEENRKKRCHSRDRVVAFANVDQTDESSQQQSVNLSEAHTNQVQETVTKWATKPTAAPVNEPKLTPSRHIGETFAENKIQVDKSNAANAPWRSTNAKPTTAEPSLKVVNVEVDSNVHFSESAESQMANHLKQQSSSTVTSSSSTSMTTSSVTEEQKSCMTSTSTMVTQPPPKSPGPHRKQQQPKGKSVARPPPPQTQPPPPAHVVTSATTTNSSNAMMTDKHSSSSGQVSMLNTSMMMTQEITQQSSQQEYHESTFSSSSTTATTNATSAVSGSGNLPVLSGWLAEETEKNTQKVEPKDDKPSAVMPVPVPKEDSSKEKAVISSEFLEIRSKMLQEVSSLRTDADNEDNEDDDFSTSQERAAERAKKERNKELAEIAEMRCRSNWQELGNVGGGSTATDSRGTPSRGLDPELEEARNTIRNAAAKWQEREQSQQKTRYGTPPSGRNTPSRRIGNLFKKGSEHWSMDADDEEEFPAPPTDIEMEVTLPAPPPRDSSKDVMMEYGNTSAAAAVGKRKNH